MSAKKHVRLAAVAITIVANLAAAPRQATAAPSLLCTNAMEPCDGDSFNQAIDWANDDCAARGYTAFNITSCTVTWYCEPEINATWQCGYAS